MTQLTGQRVMHDLRQALFAHLQRQDSAFFDRNPVGRLMTRVLNDVEAINELFTSGVVAIVGDVVTLTGVVVILLSLNWKLALVTFALVPVLVLGAAYFRLRARESYRAVRPQLARLERLPPGVAPGHDGDPALRARAPGGRGLRRASTAGSGRRSSAPPSTRRPCTRRWRPSARRRWRCSSGTGAARSWRGR